jgi:hypothetical protein
MSHAIATGTVETFLAMARDAILDTADLKPEEIAKLASCKVTYGMGDGSYAREVAMPDRDQHVIDPRTVAQAIVNVLTDERHALNAYVSASAPDWAELYIHAANGQRFYVTVRDDSEYD